MVNGGTGKGKIEGKGEEEVEGGKIVNRRCVSKRAEWGEGWNWKMGSVGVDRGRGRVTRGRENWGESEEVGGWIEEGQPPKFQTFLKCVFWMCFLPPRAGM